MYIGYLAICIPSMMTLQAQSPYQPPPRSRQRHVTAIRSQQSATKSVQVSTLSSNMTTYHLLTKLLIGPPEPDHNR